MSGSYRFCYNIPPSDQDGWITDVFADYPAPVETPQTTAGFFPIRLPQGFHHTTFPLSTHLAPPLPLNTLHDPHTCNAAQSASPHPGVEFSTVSARRQSLQHPMSSNAGRTATATMNTSHIHSEVFNQDVVGVNGVFSAGETDHSPPDPFDTPSRTDTGSTTASTGSWICPWEGCTYHGTFGRKGDLQRHIKSKHVFPRWYKCLYGCGKAFSRNDNRTAHHVRVHGQRPRVSRR
ncbi:hypothetical protein BDW74DRAFT_30652 [Aspergillus multicolor]|uniref:uncharacterized protein n=1 Tax=Aspergillus multicolor TaxID=41759 RepID=UPI003CCD9205